MQNGFTRQSMVDSLGMNKFEGLIRKFGVSRLSAT
jgi:hypothetical protein